MKWLFIALVVGGTAFGAYKFREHRIKIEMREKMRGEIRQMRSMVTAYWNARQGAPKNLDALRIRPLWDKRLKGPHAPNNRVVVVKDRIPKDTGVGLHLQS